MELSAQDREKLEKTLRGNVFGFGNPTKTMTQMGLTPLHMPFGSDQRIIDFARAGGLRSVSHLEAWIQAGVSESEGREIKLKMVSLGDIAKGMTTLIQQFVTGKRNFNHSYTVGVATSIKTVSIEGHGDVVLVIDDTMGACA